MTTKSTNNAFLRTHPPH